MGYLRFNEEPLISPKITKTYSVVSKQSFDILGEVKWFGRWRAYCFYPTSETIFDRKCMQEITDFINQLMEERKR